MTAYIVAASLLVTSSLRSGIECWIWYKMCLISWARCKSVGSYASALIVFTSDGIPAPFFFRRMVSRPVYLYIFYHSSIRVRLH